jgi:hypothetical protein
VPGLKSGAKYTTLVANIMQLYVHAKTVSIVHKLPRRQAVRRISTYTKALWYGDDMQLSCADVESVVYAQVVIATYRSVGQFYGEVERGAGILRTVLGDRSFARATYGSIDWESQPANQAIQDLGSGMRYMGIESHPLFSIGWEWYNGVRAKCGKDTFDSPSSLFQYGESKLRNKSGQALKEAYLQQNRGSPYWEAMYESLKMDIGGSPMQDFDSVNAAVDFVSAFMEDVYRIDPRDKIVGLI